MYTYSDGVHLCFTHMLYTLQKTVYFKEMLRVNSIWKTCKYNFEKLEHDH